MAFEQEKHIEEKEERAVVETDRRDENGERILYSWRAQEHVQVNKLKKHKTFLIILTVLVALWALYNSNFLFLVILILWGLIVFVSIDVQPKRHEFCITETGIKVNDTMFPYIDMQKFWIIQQIKNKKKLFVMKFTNPMKAKLHIPVPAEQSEDIRLTVNQYVPQSEHEKSLIDSVENLFS